MENPTTRVAADPQTYADRLAALPMLAGIQLAGATDGGITIGSAGLADAERGAAVGPGTRFRPGSITKALTATLVLQCVDDGLVALDDPVTKHVPGFRLLEPGAADSVTVAHLLSHSSGIDAGDLFVDTGDGDDCRARYVDLLEQAPLLFRPGAWMSYNNAGFVLAGHLVEQVRSMTWEEAMAEHVLGRLGMDATSLATGREWDAAGDGADQVRGHLAGFGGTTPLPAGTLSADPMCTRGLAPAGATLVSTAGDLARFAASHLGLRDAPPVLSAGSARAMRQLVVRAPGGVTRMAGMGFAWQIWRGAAQGQLVPRIGGANPGQSGVIACDPEPRVAIVALTNSDQGVNALNATLDGLGPGAVPDDEPAPEDLGVYAGHYASHIMEVAIDVAASGDHLELRLTRVDDARWGGVRLASVMTGVPDGPAVGAQVHLFTPVDRTTFSSPLGPAAFVDVGDDGRPNLVRWRMRALRRVSR